MSERMPFISSMAFVIYLAIVNASVILFSIVIFGDL